MRSTRKCLDSKARKTFLRESPILDQTLRECWTAVFELAHG